MRESLCYLCGKIMDGETGLKFSRRTPWICIDCLAKAVNLKVGDKKSITGGQLRWAISLLKAHRKEARRLERWTEARQIGIAQLRHLNSKSIRGRRVPVMQMAAQTAKANGFAPWIKRNGVPMTIYIWAMLITGKTRELRAPVWTNKTKDKLVIATDAPFLDMAVEAEAALKAENETKGTPQK